MWTFVHRVLSATAGLEGDIYLSSMLALKLYKTLLDYEEPQMAFCELYDDLKRLSRLDRAGCGLLAVAASRLAFSANLRIDAMSCSQNVTRGDEGSTTILT